MKFSLIIPAYNEEKRIAAVIKKFLDYYIEKYGRNFELIIVVDGDDNTLNICNEYSKKYHHLKINHSEKVRGKGAALLTGFKVASGDFIGFMDADNSVSPQEFYKLVRANSDCSIASRKMSESIVVIKQPLLRRLSSKAFNLFVNAVFHLSISDTQCGAKVLRSGIVRSIAPQMKSDGFEFDVELLWRVKKNGFGIKEVPIVWKHQESGKFSLKEGPNMLIRLLKLRINN